MTIAPIRSAIVLERTAWIRKMIAAVRQLDLSSTERFFSDARNAAAAESYLRRALEALLDLGRHILAKGFGMAVTEYKEIAVQLVAQNVLSKEDGQILRQLAGYRNRMVHFYQEITYSELYAICHDQLSDVERLCNAMLKWLRNNPDKVDNSL